MHRFWKLTLQLLARYSEWMEELKSSLELKESEREASPAVGEKNVGAGGYLKEETVCQGVNDDDLLNVTDC